MVKLTKHGTFRMKHRVEGFFNQNNLMQKVKKDGYSYHDFDGIFYNYLLGKIQKGCSLKIYNNMIYILSPNKKTFITVYPVPKKYLPIESYLLDTSMSLLIYYPNSFINKEVLITLKNKIPVTGILKNVTIINDKTVELYVKTYDNYNLKIPVKEIELIKQDNNHMFDELLRKFTEESIT